MDCYGEKDEDQVHNDVPAVRGQDVCKSSKEWATLLRSLLWLWVANVRAGSSAGETGVRGHCLPTQAGTRAL